MKGEVTGQNSAFAMVLLIMPGAAVAGDAAVRANAGGRRGGFLPAAK
jgi:hypothetical protein